VHVDWLVVALTLASAFAFAVSTNLKHVSATQVATQVPDLPHYRARAVGRFVRASLAHPLWLGGIAADVVGLGLQVLALHLGALAVVQPLLVSGLLFALLLRRREGRPVSSREVAWAIVLASCLVAFLFLVGTANGASPHEAPDRLPALAAGAAGILVAIICLVLAHRLRPAANSAALIGIAVGVTYAASASLLKAVTDIALRGPVAVLTSWQVYAVVIVGVIGLLLNQLAFQAGPLTASLPAIATVDPLLSIVVGVLIYDEHIRRGPWSGTGLFALMLLLAAAVIELGKVDTDVSADLLR
jgi:hypothetical protein